MLLRLILENNRFRLKRPWSGTQGLENAVPQRQKFFLADVAFGFFGRQFPISGRRRFFVDIDAHVDVDARLPGNALSRKMAPESPDL